MSEKIIIAIDGPASSGKSTVAKLLAKKLAYLYVDTGAMYRTVTLAAQQAGVPWEDKEALARVAREAHLELQADHGEARVFLDGREVGNEIRTPEISRLTSQCTANSPGVRQALVARQQALGKSGGVVMEGRDISTVVFPQAELKVFLNASVAERARRRIKDFEARGIAYDASKVADDIHHRDEEDRQRPVGALIKAKDAVEVVADGKGPEEIVQEILSHWPAGKAR
jgi:cytidylate kinase